MTSRRAVFDIYEIIAPRNVYLGEDNVVEAIGMGFIIDEVMVKGKTK